MKRSDPPHPPSAFEGENDPELTRWIDLMCNGDRSASELVARVLYETFHARAKSYLSGESGDFTLQPTDLVNEAYLRMAKVSQPQYQDRHHFIATAATAMRRVLLDHIRNRKAQKRKASGVQVPLDRLTAEFENRAVDLDALDTALEKLKKFDPLMSKAVELRFFLGLSLNETAEALEVPARTISRKWSLTKSWLHRELS